MKQQTLYRLGTLATMLTALGVTAGNLMYFFGRVDTIFYIWFAFVVYFLWVFAYIALFAAQAKRGNLFLFLGSVLLVIGTIFAIVGNAEQGLVVTGFLTEAQMDATTNPSILAVSAITLWTTVIGSVLFGYGTFQAGVFPRWTGILMIVLGVLWIFNENAVAFPIYAVLLTITMGWFGWAMWKITNTIQE
jgi:hypothetical protein